MKSFNEYKYNIIGIKKNIIQVDTVTEELLEQRKCNIISI